MKWSLLKKTTFWINQIELESADLSQVASAAATALELAPREVMVVDVRPGQVAFDILKHEVQAEAIAGKERAILENLARLSGVVIGEGAKVHSEGVLGLIALDPEEAAQVIRQSEVMAAEISSAVARRALVFASGAEVISGKIQDTNTPYIMDKLRRAGYRVRYGGVLEDDLTAVINRLEGALGEGVGLIVTTGGIGAEDKDINVEAIMQLAGETYTPWILKFKPDYLRHHKEGVRIALGRSGPTMLVALPGPHEEAKIGCNRLLEGIAKGLADNELAEYVASALRQRWHQVMQGRSGEHGLPSHCQSFHSS